MSTSNTLDLANYTTVWEDNFANDSQLNTNLWPVSWGNAGDYSFANGMLTLTSYASEGWSPVGFMQADNAANAAQGYGLYSAKFSLDAGQGVGIAILMWPANNVWPGAEIDLAEDWGDPTRQTGNATIHWAGAGDSNQYQTWQFNANMTQPTTVAMDWEPGSLTFYVNGQEVFQYTGPAVPKDAANGGVNETLGAEVTAAGSAPVSSSVSLHLYDMSYSAYTPGSGATTGTGGSTTGTSSSGTGSSGTPATTITLSAPGTVQEASPGAGAAVKETVSAAGLSTIYEAVFTSANVAEGNWQAVTLNASGQGSFTANFQNSGDYVVAVNDPSNPTIEGWSGAITITDPPASTPAPATTITLSAPGAVQEASPGAGVAVKESVSAAGLSTIYEAVFTSANVAEGNWQAVTLNASGQGSFTANFQNSGDYVVAVNDPSNPTIEGWSGAITITDPPASTPAPATTITLSAPGTVQEASAGAGVAVKESVSAAGLSTIYEAVFTSANVAEGNWQAVTLNASGQGSFTANFQNSGDYVVAVNDPSNPTIEGWSGAITITDPPASTPAPATTITLSAPGAVQEASPGAGVAVKESVSAAGLSTIYEAVFTSANVAEGNWQAVTLNASGQGSFTANFQNSGDYVVAVNDPSNPTIEGWSGAITITAPPAGTGSSSGSPSGTSTGNSTGSSPSGASASAPRDIALTGDNLFSTSQAWTVVGILSAADSSAVSFAMGTDPDGMFSIDGDKLLINRNMPADPAKSYQISIIAVAAGGATTTQDFTVGVKTAPATVVAPPSSSAGTGSGAIAGVTITATDAAGTSATILPGSGTTTDTVATTGLSGTVTTKVAGGTTDIATPAGSGVTSLAIHDSKGGSYQTDGFATVDATLSGATAGQLSIDDATDATVSLGSGNYNVRVSGLINTATIAMTGGSGTDRMTFIGTANATFVAGSGSTLIVGGAGDNSITFGTGTSRVWGGSGADTYTFHAGDGLQVIETFDASKGDVLDIAGSLESSLHEKVTGGSTLLTFGSNTHGILLQGVSNFDVSAIHWI